MPTVLKIIVKDALNIKAGIGGATAFTFSQSIRYGITRGLITNEAGCGTAPIAHACADTDSCVRQGFWGIFEVFFDTFVLCTLTAFVILCDTSGNYGYDIKYILSRFSSVFGGSSDIILSVCIVMFAISTLIGWSQYGVTSLSHIFSGKKSKQAYFMTYALLAVLGSIITSQLMWDLADITISVMTIINSMFLRKKIREIKYETQVYFKPYEKSK